MKKSMMIAVSVMGLSFAGITADAAPVPVFNNGQPGLRLPFANNGDPDVWGDVIQLGGYTFDTFSGTATSTGAIARYGTTFDGAGNTSNGATNITSMSELQDWVFAITLSHTGSEFNDQSFVAKTKEGTANEVRLLDLLNNGANSYTLRAGNNTLANLGALDTGAEFFHDIVVHFKADGLGGGVYDAYLNGTQVGFNVVSTSTDHEIDFLQLNTYAGSVDKWRQIRIGQVVPEPASAALIGLAGLMMTRRSKR